MDLDTIQEIKSIEFTVLSHEDVAKLLSEQKKEARKHRFEHEFKTMKHVPIDIDGKDWYDWRAFNLACALSEVPDKIKFMSNGKRQRLS